MLDDTQSPLFKTQQLKDAITVFRQQAASLEEVPLEPIHADPNIKNFLLTQEKLYIIDWDDISLSDPMHDIAQILWQHLLSEKWDEFFSAYGLAKTNCLMKRFYWWIARNSLNIALWFDIEKKDPETAKQYVADFYAAIAALGK